MGNDMNDILMLEEKETVEFKSGKEKIPLSFYETYSAFANTKGGTIYLGIRENEAPPHTVEGVINARQKRKQLFDALNNKEKVSACLVSEEDIEILNFPEGDVIKVDVPEASRLNKPVYINGDITKSYFRSDSGDHFLSSERIASMINDKGDARYDQRPNGAKIQVEDLDPDSLELFVQSIVRAGKLQAAGNLNSRTLLQRIGAMVRDSETGNYELTKGAVIFLGKTADVNAMCPHLWLDYVLRDGGEARWANRITSKDLSCEGNVFQFYMRAINSILNNAPTPFHVEGIQDVGKQKVGSILREAFANAISNMDLFDPTGLSVDQTANAICFTNSGTMLVPLEDALLGGYSKPRNPVIFAFFQAMGISDHGGYGIPFIWDTCKELGYVSPVIEEDKVRNKTRLNIMFRASHKELSSEEQRIYNVLIANPGGLTVFEIAALTGIGRDRTRRSVESLAAMALICDNKKPTKGRKYFPAKELD